MFPSVDPKQSFPNLEENVLQYWKANKLFEKSIESRPAENPYRFYDGPPFITGTPHYGSLLSSVVKDAVGRYWTMQGKRVERVWGWDCHGLPIEEKVQKKLGLSSNRDIEKVGVKKFIDECYTYTKETSDEWPWYIDHIGRWVDMDNAYRTMDQDYMESVLWVFKQLYDKNYVYEGKRVSLYSWKLGTPISNFEVAMDNSYQEVNDPAITVKFDLSRNGGKWEGVSVLAWTTTPWTIPAHMALAVNEAIEYVLVENEGSKYVVAKNRVEAVFKGKGEYEIVGEVSGKELVGLSYAAPFPQYYQDKVDQSKSHRIYHADFITDTDGTGIGHEAPEFGDVDFELGKANGIHISAAMDDEGKYTGEITDLTGTFYQDANPIVMDRLSEKGLLFKKESITHRVPFCPRSGTPLVQKAQNSWFIDIANNKDKLQEANKDINWFPEHLKFGRFAKGIDSAPDWCISRTRFWGAPMPVWIGRDENGVERDRKVFGSKAEIEAASGMKVENLHKPYIDDIVWQENGLTYRRIPEVLDVWMDSGSMPYAQMHYPFENKQAMEASFPADFIAEYVGQVRAWFYVMHVLGVLLFGKPAFTNVITTGVIYGTDGRKMSKSFKNYPDSKDTILKYGADPIRFYLLNSPLLSGGDINFSEDGIVETIKRVILPLWNTYSFFTTYANIDGWTPSKGSVHFVRHGQTDANLQHRLSDGLENSPLNETGRGQAEATGKSLAEKGMKFDVIIVSPLERAIETANIVAKETGFDGEIVIAEDLIEHSAGAYSGRLYEEIIEEHFAATGERYERHEVISKIVRQHPSSESDLDFYERNARLYEEIAAKYPDKKVLVVAHGGTFRAWCKHVYGLTNEAAFSKTYSIKNAECVELPKVARTNPLDRWMMGELHSLVAKVQDSFERYDLQTGARAIVDFMDDLTNWYVRRSRRRFWKSESDADKASAYETLYTVLTTVCKVAAPMIPFVTEHIYRGLTGEESVHLEYFPAFERFAVSSDLLADMKKTKTLVTLGLALRARKKLRVRQPLMSITIGEKLDEYYLEILREELNVKEVKFDDMSKHAKLVCRPNARLIGPKFGKAVQEVIVAAKSGNFQSLESGRVQVGEFVLEPGEFELAYEPLSVDADIEGGEGMVLMMDTAVTEELRLEGYARDIVRMIQDLRKEAAYQVSDRIRVGVEAQGDIADAISRFQSFIASETLADSIEFAPMPQADVRREEDLEGEKFAVSVTKA